MPTHSDPVIAVVCGGPSAEASVSRVSGNGVATALKASYSKVLLLELEPRIDEALRANRVDVVFPALHGPPGEDGTFQGFLETLAIPYVGSDVHASACAMDKTLAKHFFRHAGLPVAEDAIVGRDDDVPAAARRIFERFGGGAVVKPSRQGSALGVSFAGSAAELEKAIASALTYDERVLIEQRISGKEITVGILERDEVEVLPVVEVRTPAGSWYDYEHRYQAGLSEHVVPAPLPERTYARTQEIAKLAHIALGCRDLSRVDFVVPEQGEPIVLEVNTLPGMTPTSLYPDAARAAGVPFEELVALLVERALARGRKAAK